MKFIITEQQINNIIFQYLDDKNFKIVENNNFIYFIENIEDGYYPILYNKKSKNCYTSYTLIDEISTFFSLSNGNTLKVIGRWVENTLQMEVIDNFISS